MSGTHEDAGLSVPAPNPAESRRAGHEFLLELVFRPLSDALVQPLARLRVPPPAVVLANATVGLAAAFAIGVGNLVLGALLLQAKTVLDNADGSLARATGRVSLAGRYLDTIADLAVNVAVFVALAHVTGRTWLAAAALVALTLVLAVDFNVSTLAREGDSTDGADDGGRGTNGVRSSGSSIERVLGWVYTAVFAPQDRLVRAVSNRRFRAAAGDGIGAERSAAARDAYFDRVSLTVLANLGLTTQLAALGLCLVVGVPALYLWLAIASLVALVPLQLRRERCARRVARS